MSYTAMEKMRKENRRKFKRDIGPFQPPLYINRHNRNDLKSAALRFLRESCEELKFSPEKEEEEKSGVYLGKSIKAGQIPYNMEMDINRLCLEKSLETFFDSGVAEDAYAVYFCFLEIFFGQYGRSKKMVELLSEYEANGSSLLMTHRDHYSHSVYVFALGLAIYETNSKYRRVFREFYHLDPDDESPEKARKAANLFLEYWGLAALFHDIGYPFELPFEQVLSYFEVDNQKRGAGSLFLAYHSVESLTALDDGSKERMKALYKRSFKTTSDLLAFDITKKLGQAYDFDEKYLRNVIICKPTKPEDFGYYMDHAFFSAARLFGELAKILKPQNLTEMHIDALSAILLHNSLYKFAVAHYKEEENRKAPLLPSLHPLAWMLMLCDELQCWDRTAYGRNSRHELHPMAASFDFSGSKVSAVYYYDKAEQEKIEAFRKEYEEWEKNPENKEEPRLKAYSDMAGKKLRFTTDIEKIVDTTILPLTVVPSLRKQDRRGKHTYLSDSNFLHMYDFAVALHARNMPKGTPISKMEEKFAASSLEYQLSTLSRARCFARYLDAIGCFYTDRPVDYEMVTRFGPKEAAVFAPLEHERWIREHAAMGWHYSKYYEKAKLDVPKEKLDEERKALRERMRGHKLVMDGKPTSEEILEHYNNLSARDQGKDWRPFNNLLELLRSFDGLHIYRLD